MPRDIERRIVFVTRELMHVKGWGAEPHRLADRRRFRELREPAEVDQDDDLDPETAGSIILQHLVDAIESFPEGLHGFDGKQYPANVMKTAFYLELRIGTTDGHYKRWLRLVTLLSLRYSYDQWRKQRRLKRALLAILAEHMVRRATNQTTA